MIVEWKGPGMKSPSIPLECEKIDFPRFAIRRTVGLPKF